MVIKPNIGGGGAGIVRFDTLDDLRAAANADVIDLGIDHTALVQEYLPADGNSIVRVEVLGGDFLYAIRIALPDDGFNLSDPFLHFHFRFLEPYAQEGILSYQPERVLPAIVRDLRAFVGSTAWEELARQWTLAQRVTNALKFTPEVVGSHWSRTVQIDVVAINWQTHDILLGECKWGADAIDRKIVRELLAKAPLVLADLPSAGANWRVHYALFTRGSATPAARRALAAHDGILVDLARLYDDLTAVDA